MFLGLCTECIGYFVHSQTQQDGFLRRTKTRFFSFRNFNHQTNAKILFLFFQPFLFSNCFFLDHHTTFGLSKTDLGTFLFQLFSFRKSMHSDPLLWGHLWTIWNNIPISFESEELLEEFPNLAFSWKSIVFRD